MKHWGMTALVFCLAFSMLQYPFARTHAVTTHGQGSDSVEREAVLGDFASGYVSSGCDPVLPGSGLSLTLPPCAAYPLQTTPVRRLTYTAELTARTLTVPAADATIWLALQQDAGATVSGWTGVSGTHYLWRSSATRPPLPANGLLLARVSVVAGALTERRRLFATNPTHPGRIYATDPYIGARCDGTTDDSQALQRALSLASERGGTTVELPEGTCVAKNLVLDNQTLDSTIPSGLDDADLRSGCASVVGQGAGKTVLTPPASALAADWVLQSSCTPLGAGHYASPYPGNFPGGVVLADFSISGRQNRTLESHGLIVEGGYVHVRDVQIHSINGTGLWIGKNEKLESGWFTGVHVRHSGRYVTDGGRSDGLPGSSNNAAVLLDQPVNGTRNNNLSFYGLQVGFPWYTGVQITCTTTFNGNIHFYASMLHGSEGPAGSGTGAKQGRLNTDTGLVYLNGGCFNISFHGANANTPGSDAAASDDPTGPPVPLFHLADTRPPDGGHPTGYPGPDAVYLSDIYGNNSVAGQLIRISRARAVLLTGVRAGTNVEVDYPDGQLVVASDSGVLLALCQNLFHPPFLQVPYALASSIKDCGRETHNALVLADSARALGVNTSGTFSMASGSTVATLNHMLPCTPSAGHFSHAIVEPPNVSLCESLMPLNITATTVDWTCDTAPGGNGMQLAFQVFVPTNCGTALLTQAERPLWHNDVGARLYIHGMQLTARLGVTADATNYAVVTLYHRKLLTQTALATWSTQTAGWVAWTPVVATLAATPDLIWEPGDTLSYAVTKFGTGVALPEFVLSVVTAGNVALTP